MKYTFQCVSTAISGKEIRSVLNHVKGEGETAQPSISIVTPAEQACVTGQNYVVEITKAA